LKKLKVLLINTYDNYGGASLACVRLLKALNQCGVEAKLLVQVKNLPNAHISGTSQGWGGKKLALARFALERWQFSFYERDKSVRFAFSPAITGIDISQHPWVQEADVLHLHWINFGFLSLHSLQKLIALKKPIVWTLHDMWAFTGGCHYTGDCQNFHHSCGNCYMLHHPKPQDWSYQVFQKKFRLYHQSRIHFVTCSRWLGETARQSSLLKRSINSPQAFAIQTIPNPIDTEIFAPLAKKAAQQALKLPQTQFLLLFGAMNIADKRKGLAYLQQALDFLAQQYSHLSSHIELVVFGKSQPEVLAKFPFKTHNLGFLSSDEALVQVYSAAHAFILPSLEDNLPNTVMEALACATPVVAFRTGGVPEMIDHQQNGYLADYQSSEDLAKGILWVYEQYSKSLITNHLADTYTQTCQNARQKVLTEFNEAVVGQKYFEVYQEITKQ
jgi:glycosyltransferase involved in cell wall biosynthesis